MTSANLYGGHYVGEAVGTKILTAYVGVNTYGHHLWLWRCADCAEEKGPSTLSHMRRGIRCNTCAFKREQNPRWKGYKQLTGVWLWDYQNGAKKRGLPWTVTPEQIWEQWLKQDGSCAYTGWLLVHGVDASLDRVDNVRGYEPGNIQFVHRDINRMKSNFPEEHFMKLCRAVAGC